MQWSECVMQMVTRMSEWRGVNEWGDGVNSMSGESECDRSEQDEQANKLNIEKEANTLADIKAGKPMHEETHQHKEKG